MVEEEARLCNWVVTGIAPGSILHTSEYLHLSNENMKIQRMLDAKILGNRFQVCYTYCHVYKETYLHISINSFWMQEDFVKAWNMSDVVCQRSLR